MTLKLPVCCPNYKKKTVNKMLKIALGPFVIKCL